MIFKIVPLTNGFLVSLKVGRSFSEPTFVETVNEALDLVSSGLEGLGTGTESIAA